MPSDGVTLGSNAGIASRMSDHQAFGTAGFRHVEGSLSSAVCVGTNTVPVGPSTSTSARSTATGPPQMLESLRLVWAGALLARLAVPGGTPRSQLPVSGLSDHRWAEAAYAPAVLSSVGDGDGSGRAEPVLLHHRGRHARGSQGLLEGERVGGRARGS